MHPSELWRTLKIFGFDIVIWCKFGMPRVHRMMMHIWSTYGARQWPGEAPQTNHGPPLGRWGRVSNSLACLLEALCTLFGHPLHCIGFWVSFSTCIEIYFGTPVYSAVLSEDIDSKRILIPDPPRSVWPSIILLCFKLFNWKTISSSGSITLLKPEKSEQIPDQTSLKRPYDHSQKRYRNIEKQDWLQTGMRMVLEQSMK